MLYINNMPKLKRDFHVIIEKDEDGYFIADVPELPGCHTQARSLDVLVKRTADVIRLYLEAKGQSKSGVEFIGVQRLAV